MYSGQSDVRGLKQISKVKGQFFVADGIFQHSRSATGIARIINSVKSIFQNLSKSNDSEPNALWNAFKNLFRGIAEACPFSGIFLIIFDSVRNSVSIHSKIAKEIQNQENIAGIAIDGKVIFTIDLTLLDNFIKIKPTSEKHRLAIFKDLSLEFLKIQERNGCSLKMTEIFPKLKEAIENKSRDGANSNTNSTLMYV